MVASHPTAASVGIWYHCDSAKDADADATLLRRQSDAHGEERDDDDTTSGARLQPS